MNEMEISVGHHLASSEQHQQGSNAAGGWNGLTIKEILEKVDLFNITVEDDDPIKGEKVLVGKARTPAAPNSNRVVSSSYPESAFLGPKLWDKPIPLPPAVEDADTEFSIMNIEDFLNENNINLDDIPQHKNEYQESSESQSSSSEGDDQEQQQQKTSNKTAHRHNIIPKDVSNDFLYAESKRARAEREREEKRRKMEVEMEFAPEDLALATIPGANFDPRKRVFSTEELKPQPIIRKRKKHYVPSESKDDRYWEKRVKNNVAARRSREARRLKENQIALRAAFLERENNLLKLQMEEVRADNQRLAAEKRLLQEKLTKYQQM